MSDNAQNDGRMTAELEALESSEFSEGERMLSEIESDAEAVGVVLDRLAKGSLDGATVARIRCATAPARKSPMLELSSCVVDLRNRGVSYRRLRAMLELAIAEREEQGI